MRKCSFLFLFYVSCLAASGQHLSYTRYELLRLGGQENIKNIDNQYEEIKGDAFFSPQWLAGTLSGKQGTYSSGLKLKFDKYANKLYANFNDTIYDLSSASFTGFCIYPNYPDTSIRSVFRKGFVAADFKLDQFMQVLADGKLIFLKQQAIQIKEVHEDSFLATTKKFIGQDYYYIGKKDIFAQAVRLNKTGLEQQLSDKWKDVSQYLKEKGLSASSEEGWISAIKFYNSLP